MSHKEYDPLRSPFVVIYPAECDGLVTARFDEIYDLMVYMVDHGLTVADVVIMHGEVVAGSAKCVHNKAAGKIGPCEPDSYDIETYHANVARQ